MFGVPEIKNKSPKARVKLYRMNQKASAPTWAESLKLIIHPRVLNMLFLGFSAGIPLLLIFSSLSLWLREAGVDRKAVTFFSWAALGYSFKFVWAPLVDVLPLPILGRWLGRRRSWLLFSQSLIAAALFFMGSIDPALGPEKLHLMALAAVLLGFSSATQDIVIDAYRIESAETRIQAMMSSSYVAGYRLGMVCSGAGALFLASFFGSEMGSYSFRAWQLTYFIMASTLLVGIVTTLASPEPKIENRISKFTYKSKDYLRLVLLFALVVGVFVTTFFFVDRWVPLDIEGLSKKPFLAFLFEALRFLLAAMAATVAGLGLVKISFIDKKIASQTWVEPVKDFFSRYGMKTSVLLLTLVGLYRISDIVLGVISNVFYQDMGYSKNEIATAVKTFAIFVTIAGGFLGGIFSSKFGVMKALIWGAAMSALTNILFIFLSHSGHNLPLLYLVVGADNLAAGFASAAFIAFLSSLTNVAFTAVQYAIFSSLMTLFPKVLGGYSGTLVEHLSYTGFFTFTTILGLPVLCLCILANRNLTLR